MTTIEEQLAHLIATEIEQRNAFVEEMIKQKCTILGVTPEELAQTHTLVYAQGSDVPQIKEKQI